jgi:hypothetical protein
MPVFDWNIPSPLHFGRSEQSRMSLIRALPQGTRRSALEAFVWQRFNQGHGADIRHFMPQLFGLTDNAGVLCAVSGARLAADEPLFLERYLNEPIEALIHAAAQQAVDRTTIVEVGNLAADDTGSARLSIIVITYLLAMSGLEWVAFTGSIGLVNSFRRLGLNTLALFPAEAERLGDEQHDWGRYYDSKPWVHAGNIRSGFVHLHNTGMFNRLGLPVCMGECSHVA